MTIFVSTLSDNAAKVRVEELFLLITDDLEATLGVALISSSKLTTSYYLFFPSLDLRQASYEVGYLVAKHNGVFS